MNEKASIIEKPAPGNGTHAHLKAVEMLLKEERRYRMLLKHLPAGFAYCRIVPDEKGEPSDFIFLEVNRAFERFAGLARAEIVGKRASEILAGIEESSFDWFGVLGKVALEGENTEFEQYLKPLKKWFSVSAFSIEEGHFALLLSDINHQRRTEEALARQRTLARY